jgi:hypothetical protein
MDWLELESFGLDCPLLADELVGREALEGFELSSEIVGVEEVGEVAAQLVVVVVVIPFDGRLLDCSVHSLDLAVIRYEIIGALLSGCFRKGDGDMVSPSGTRGAGSTKVRAGRR